MTRVNPARTLPQTATVAPAVPVVVLAANGQRYAIAATEIEQILPMAELQRPAGAPRLLAGFLNLAGHLVPVVFIHRLFGLAEPKLDLWTPLVILRGTEQRLALLFDRVEGFQSISADAILPLAGDHAADESISGLLAVEDQTAFLLSPAKLLLKQEQAAIADWQRRVERRVDALKEQPA